MQGVLCLKCVVQNLLKIHLNKILFNSSKCIVYEAFNI